MLVSVCILLVRMYYIGTVFVDYFIWKFYFGYMFYVDCARHERIKSRAAFVAMVKCKTRNKMLIEKLCICFGSCNLTNFQTQGDNW